LKSKHFQRNIPGSRQVIVTTDSTQCWLPQQNTTRDKSKYP